VIASTDEGVVVRLGWRKSTSGTAHEMFQVLRLREGRVVDMGDHSDRRAAPKIIDA
jgi:hypothetical protein